jgi:hypothetical protein
MTLAVVVAAFSMSAAPQVAVSPPNTTGAQHAIIVSGILCGMTADSMSVAEAGSLSAKELGRWTADCRNMSTVPLTLSWIGFKLDFMELGLRPLDADDVTDVFNQKQKMSKAAKTAKVFEWVGLAALLASGGQTYWKLTERAAARMAQASGLTAYIATKAGDYFTKAIPSTTNALAHLLTQDVTLQPGQGVEFKVYASKMPHASHLGPKLLTQPEVK